MQMHLQQRIARTQRPPLVYLPMSGNLDPFSQSMHLVVPHQWKDQVSRTRGDDQKWGSWLGRRQIGVAVDERRHVNGKRASGLSPIANLVSQHVFRLRRGIPEKSEFGRHPARTGEYRDIDIGIVIAAGRTA